MKGNRKYEMTDETIVVKGHVLHRIRAKRCIDSHAIRKGSLGGFIEGHGNLSVDGDSWVGENAIVFGDASVRGDAYVGTNACVCGMARVYGDAKVTGSATVLGMASVHDTAYVSGKALVDDCAVVCCSAHVVGNAHVGGYAILTDHMLIGNDAYVMRNKDVMCFSDMLRMVHTYESFTCANDVNGGLSWYGMSGPDRMSADDVIGMHPKSSKRIASTIVRAVEKVMKKAREIKAW